MIGGEDEVREQIAAVAAAGATDFRATELCPSPDDAARTRALLTNLARGGVTA